MSFVYEYTNTLSIVQGSVFDDDEWSWLVELDLLMKQVIKNFVNLIENVSIFFGLEIYEIKVNMFFIHQMVQFFQVRKLFLDCWDNWWDRARILIQVTIYRRLLIGRDDHLDQSEAYDIS